LGGKELGGMGRRSVFGWGGYGEFDGVGGRKREEEERKREKADKSVGLLVFFWNQYETIVGVQSKGVQCNVKVSRLL